MTLEKQGVRLAGGALFLLATAVAASSQPSAFKLGVGFEPDQLTVTVRNTSGSTLPIDARAVLHLATPSTEAGPIRRFWTSAALRVWAPIKGGQRARILVPPNMSLPLPVVVSPLEWYEGISPDEPRTPVSVPAGWYELTASVDSATSNRILVVVDRTGQVAAGK